MRRVGPSQSRRIYTNRDNVMCKRLLRGGLVRVDELVDFVALVGGVASSSQLKSAGFSAGLIAHARAVALSGSHEEFTALQMSLTMTFL